MKSSFDYRLTTYRGRLTHIFQLANPVAFDIKTYVQQGLSNNQYEGREAQFPHEHLGNFYEPCQYCVPPAHVTEDKKKLRLFAFTLTGRARIGYCHYRVEPYKLGMS